MPFLAVNKGHGSTTTLAKLHNDIDVYVCVFDKIVIAKDRDSACVSGGVYTAKLISTLWLNEKTSGK